MDIEVKEKVKKMHNDAIRLAGLMDQLKASADSSEEDKKEWEDFKSQIIPRMEDIIKNIDHITGMNEEMRKFK